MLIWLKICLFGTLVIYVMAKGDYLSKYGGSRNAYNKGRADAQKSLLVQLGKAILKVLTSKH